MIVPGAVTAQCNVPPKCNSHKQIIYAGLSDHDSSSGWKFSSSMTDKVEKMVYPECEVPVQGRCLRGRLPDGMVQQDAQCARVERGCGNGCNSYQQDYDCLSCIF